MYSGQFVKGFFDCCCKVVPKDSFWGWSVILISADLWASLRTTANLRKLQIFNSCLINAILRNHCTQNHIDSILRNHIKYYAITSIIRYHINHTQLRNFDFAWLRNFAWSHIFTQSRNFAHSRNFAQSRNFTQSHIHTLTQPFKKNCLTQRNHATFQNNVST
jgi:hypothetical protein